MKNIARGATRLGSGSLRMGDTLLSTSVLGFFDTKPSRKSGGWLESLVFKPAD